jgi:hypothetical protein
LAVAEINRVVAKSFSGGAMSTDDFILYPTNRVVGTIDDPKDARGAIEALSKAGFADDEIDVLHGEEGLHRLDPTGAEHGVFARFQRTLIRATAQVEEYKHLSRHVDDVRAGRFVFMVLAREPARRDVAADILSSHGAEFVGFYGRWALQALNIPGARIDREDSAAGATYEMHVEGGVTRVRVESASAAAVSDDRSSSPDLRADVTRIAPGIFLLSWQDADKGAMVYVADVTRGAAYAVIPGRDGTLRHVAGTVRRLR